MFFFFILALHFVQYIHSYTFIQETTYFFSVLSCLHHHHHHHHMHQFHSVRRRKILYADVIFKVDATERFNCFIFPLFISWGCALTFHLMLFALFCSCNAVSYHLVFTHSSTWKNAPREYNYYYLFSFINHSFIHAFTHSVQLFSFLFTTLNL